MSAFLSLPEKSVGRSAYSVKGAVTETFHATQSTTVEKTIDIKTNTSFIHVQSPTEIKWA